MDYRVLHLAHEMDVRISCRLTVAELAAEVGLSVSQLTSLFLRDTGLTPGDYLQRQRMSRARWLLEQTSLSVAQTMTAVGIADRKHFARGFRLAYGLTPRMLRLQRRTVARTAVSESATLSRMVE
jgi:transcriptional regulator GlxA family with amidase domain